MADPTDTRGLQGDDEVAALLALDALEDGEQADAELRLGSWPHDLADATLPLAASIAVEPPADLRDEVLARALARRPAGRPPRSPESLTPFDAFARTIEDFRALLDSLDDAAWGVVAHEEHGTVHDLVAHLVGVERLNLRWLDPDHDVPYLPDHVASTRDVVASLDGTPPAALLQVWHQDATALLAATRRLDGDRQVTFHDLTLSVDGLLTTRTFELWAHGMDIAVATGRPLPMLDDARMRLMSSRLMGALSRALLYRGVDAGEATARFVLTGPAGGCYDVPLGFAPTQPDREPDLVLVADVVDLCRVATARLRPADLAHTVEGDTGLAAVVLRHLDAFARD